MSNEPRSPLRGLGKYLGLALSQECVLCGERSGEALLCPACSADLPTLPALCPVCALPAPAGAVCGECSRRSPHFDRTLALWRYDFPCDALVQALKYRARLPLAKFFAAALGARIVRRADIIVPMPLHRRRLAERGFNHAVEIARHLEVLTGIPVAADAVERVRHTPVQAGLPYADRAANVRGAFACRADLRDKRIAVVDDVMTTGTTLNELAAVLKKAGAADVENCVVARTLLD